MLFEELEMKAGKYLALTAGILMILASCATGGGSSGGRRPAWVDDKHSVYPESEYLVEVGEGTSLKDAKQNGLMSLSQVFRTTVKVDSTVRTRYVELSDGKKSQGASMETTVDDQITQLSDETLVNVHFGESWTDDMGRTYVIAYIDRLETARIYRQRIQEDANRTAYFIKESARQDDLLKKFGYLDAAVVMDKNSQMMLDQLDIIHSPSRSSIMLDYSSAELYSLYSDTASLMAFDISILGDEQGKLSAMVAQVMTGRGFALAEDRANLHVDGKISVEDANLDNGYENVRWTLFLEMKDQSGKTVVTMEEQKRETGISRDAAVSKAYRSMEEMLQKKFIGDLERYFDSFAGQ